MKNLLRPVFLSLTGYLICVIYFLVDIALGLNQDYVQLCWALGIGIHLVASVMVIKRKGHWFGKMVYLLVPVPLGFILTFSTILLSYILMF